MSANPRIRDWSGRRVWLVGASTGIGAALARALSARGARLALSARSRADLEEVAADCPGALVLPVDLTDNLAFDSAHDGLRGAWGELDLVIFLAGTYRPLRAAELRPGQVGAMLAVNFTGVADGVAVVLPPLLARGAGAVALVASVAGYRGLPKALAYGPGKAALINFAESLYLDLQPRGLGVFLINPGFVDTRLTAGNDFTMPALITPQAAAEAIIEGFAAGRFEIHFPRRFTLFMKLLRILPGSLYRALAALAAGDARAH